MCSGKKRKKSGIGSGKRKRRSKKDAEKTRSLERGAMMTVAEAGAGA